MLLSVTIKFFGKPRNESLANLIARTDEELVQYYKQTDDMQAVSILMDRYSDAIVGLSMRYLKDEEEVRDFAGDMYIKLVDKLKEADVRKFRPWLLTSVNNRLKDFLRKRKVRDDYKNAVRGYDEGSEENVDFEMDQDQLQQAMTRLNEKEQKVIYDLYIMEKSYKEIEEETGMTFNQVRGIRDRAIKKLKSDLQHVFGDYFKD